MKKIKYMTLLFMIFVISVSLTACVRETHTVDISSNGGTVLHEQVITKEVYNQLISIGSDVNDLKEEGYTITFFEEDGIEYVKASKKQKFDDLSALERYFQELSTSNEGSNSEKYFTTFNLESKDNIIEISGVIGKPDASAVYTSSVMIINFSGKITQYDIGEKIDSNTLEIDLMNLWANNAGKEFVIKASDSNFGFFIILIGILLIIGFALILFVIITVILIVVLKKKKSDKNSVLPPEEDIKE